MDRKVEDFSREDDDGLVVAYTPLGYLWRKHDRASITSFSWHKLFLLYAERRSNAFMTGTEILMARKRPCRLNTDPPSTCRKFLGLKLTHQRTATMFVEILYRCSSRAVAKGRQDSRKLVFILLLTWSVNYSE